MTRKARNILDGTVTTLIIISVSIVLAIILGLLGWSGKEPHNLEMMLGNLVALGIFIACWVWTYRLWTSYRDDRRANKPIISKEEMAAREMKWKETKGEIGRFILGLTAVAVFALFMYAM